MRRLAASDKFILLASFCLPLGIILFVFALLGIAPFGDLSLAIIDANQQYISFSGFLANTLRNGESLLYSWKEILGGPVAGLFGYYLSSPFELLFLLFPQESILSVFDMMLALKLATCGFTMALYFRERSKFRLTTLLFTTSYALCGFNTVLGWCVMWLDAVYMLPLLAMGLHRIAEGESPALYIVSLGLIIIFNYYIGYMVCIFSVMYYVYLRMSTRESLKPDRGDLLFCVSSLGAGALSSVMLLPVLGAMRGAGGVSFMDSVRKYTYPAMVRLYQLIAPSLEPGVVDRLVLPTLLVVALVFLMMFCAVWKICRNQKVPGKKELIILALIVLVVEVWHIWIDRYIVTAEYMLNGERTWSLHKIFLGYADFDEICKGCANIYAGPLIPLLIGFFLLNREIPWKERGAALFLIFLFYLSFTLVFTNSAWHLFTEPHFFYFRYSFCCSFVLLVLGEKSFQARENITPRRAVGTGVIVFLLAVGAAFMIPPEISWKHAVFTVLVTGILGLLMFAGIKGKRKSIIAVCGVLHVLAICAVLFINYRYQARELSIQQPLFQQALSDGNAAVTKLKALDTGAYRTRNKSDWLNKNDPMLFDYIGSSHFSSSEKRKNTDFMRSLGIRTFRSRWASGNYGQSRAADSMLGVKYVFMPFLDYSEVVPGIYQNPYNFGMAFVAPLSVIDVTLDIEEIAAENLNRVYWELGVETPVFVEQSAECVDQKADYQEFRFRAETDVPYYVQLNTTMPERITLLVNGDLISTFEDAEEDFFYINQLSLLGSFQPGQEIAIQITPSQPGTSPTIKFYSENSDVLSETCHRILSQPAELVMHSDDHVTAHVHVLDEDQCLILSVPYDRAWNITVDGVETEAAEAFGELLAIPVQPGDHTIEMHYWPKGLTLGILVSSVTCLSIGIYCLRRKRSAK